MRIQHNIAAVNSYRNLSGNQSALSKNLEKLSSGFRINRAADDAAGLAISEGMRSKINGLDQATANAKDAVGLIQTAEGALTEVHSMLQRMTTLATQSANGTYNTEARESIQKEVNALGKEINRIATSTEYNDQYMLTGAINRKTGDDAAAALDDNKLNTDAFEGGADLTFQIGPTSDQKLVLTTLDMTVGDTAAGIFADGTAATEDTKATFKMLDVTTVGSANQTISNVQGAIKKVSSYRADLGASQNRLEHTINNMKTTSENMTAAESRIRDTDMAKEMASYTKNNILSQAAQSMLAQANQAPQGVLQLLR